MPRHRESRKRKKYDSEVIKSAVKAVSNGMKIAQAAKQYHIPRMTLSDHVKRDKIEDGKVIIKVQDYGEQSKIFTCDQETRLTERLIHLSKRGFPLNVCQLRQKAFEYAWELKRKGLPVDIPPSWIKNQMAGKDWYLSFRSRHPEISLRKPEGLSSNRAEAFNKERIDNYFMTLNDIVGENFDPRLIFNVDETGLSSVPNTPGKVLAEKGARVVSCVETGERGVLTTVLPCISAAGDLMQPFIIFKGKRKDENLRNELEKYNVNAEMSESGYIDKTIFLKFLKFFQANRPNPYERCCLILDGHASHTGIDVLSYAAENKIELLCIPPHSSHRLQPLDTSWNGPLKKLWEQLVREHLHENSVVRINRFEFLKLLRVVWSRMSEKRHLIVKGFQHCGIYPVKNVVHPSEYEMSKSFETAEPESTNKVELRSSQTATEKVIFRSPLKTASSAHKRPHTTHLTSQENMTAKRKRMDERNQTKSKLPVRIGDDSTRKHTRLPTWMTENVSELSSASIGPSTSAGVQVNAGRPTSITARQKKASSCSSCGQAWKQNMLDFYKCIICAKWSCENCFEVERCFDCL